MIEKYQYAAIILTAIVGIYGTYFDFKKNNKITIHGWVAIGLLVMLCVVSLTLENEKHEEQIRANLEAKQLAEEANLQLRNTLSEVKNASSVMMKTVATLTSLEEKSNEAANALEDLLNPLEVLGFSFAVSYPNPENLFPAYAKMLKILANDCVPRSSTAEIDPPDHCLNINPMLKTIKEEINGVEVPVNTHDNSTVVFYYDSPAFMITEQYIADHLEGISVKMLEDEYIPWLNISQSPSNESILWQPPDTSIGFMYLNQDIQISKGIQGRIELYNRMFVDLQFGDRPGREGAPSPRIRTPKSDYDITLLYQYETDTLTMELNHVSLHMEKDNEIIRSKYDLLEPDPKRKRLIYLRSFFPFNPNLEYLKIHYGHSGSTYNQIPGDQFVELNGPLGEGRFTDNRWAAVIKEREK